MAAEFLFIGANFDIHGLLRGSLGLDVKMDGEKTIVSSLSIDILRSSCGRLH